MIRGTFEQSEPDESSLAYGPLVPQAPMPEGMATADALGLEAQMAWELGHYYMHVLEDASAAGRWWSHCAQLLERAAPEATDEPSAKRVRPTINGTLWCVVAPNAVSLLVRWLIRQYVIGG